MRTKRASRFSGLFAYIRVLLLLDHPRVGRLEIREAMSQPISLWNSFPLPMTRLFAPIPHCLGYHLSCLESEGNPNPEVVRFFEDKRPQLIQFQDGGCGIFWVLGE